MKKQVNHLSFLMLAPYYNIVCASLDIEYIFYSDNNSFISITL